MNLILALDDADGMAFNRRRQSRDRVLNQKIVELCGGHTLVTDPYTASLFPELSAPRLRVTETPERNTGKGEFCFPELSLSLTGSEPELETIYVFRWNRAYPSDRKADLPFSVWKKEIAAEFPGSSHEKITLEVYTR